MTHAHRPTEHPVPTPILQGLADIPAWLLIPLPILRLSGPDALANLAAPTLRFTESRGKLVRAAGEGILSTWRAEHASGRVAAKAEPDGTVRLMRIDHGRFEFLSAHPEGSPRREVRERAEGSTEFTEERLGFTDVEISVRRYVKRIYVAVTTSGGPDEANFVQVTTVLEKTPHAEYDHRFALARAVVTADETCSGLRDHLNRAYAASVASWGW